MSGELLRAGSQEHIYRGTTMPIKDTGTNVVKAVKKLIVGTAQKELLLNKKLCNEVKLPRLRSESGQSPEDMPATNAEEAALLSTVPTDMDDIELQNIQLQFPSGKRMSDGSCNEVRVRTDRGDMLVAVQGDRKKPAIFTYHDLGLNYESSFQAFFGYPEMRAILKNFCVYHLNAPGQEEGAASLPADYVYPDMDELASQINYVLGHFGVKTFVGFGIGAGANILARYAKSCHQHVDALVLINCTSTQSGWIEWGYQKMNSRNLRTWGMTEGVLDYLMWHHFGRKVEDRNQHLTELYRNLLTKNVNPTNLSMFINSYYRRSDLGIHRDERKLKVPVLNVTGALSPHVDDTVTFNGRLDPANSTWMKISDCGMVLEEKPDKMSEAFRLFLQGHGYVAPLSPNQMMQNGRQSFEQRKRNCRQSSVIRITENPISEAVAC